jgi:hypothetical protein
MSKAHRGKGIRDLAFRGRGSCPVCSRKNIKVLYEQEVGEGETKTKIRICKTCKAALKHNKKTVPQKA